MVVVIIVIIIIRFIISPAGGEDEEDQEDERDRVTLAWNFIISAVNFMEQEWEAWEEKVGGCNESKAQLWDGG